MGVQLAARRIRARGVGERCLEEREVPLEGTVVLGRAGFERFEPSGERRRHWWGSGKSCGSIATWREACVGVDEWLEAVGDDLGGSTGRACSVGGRARRPTLPALRDNGVCRQQLCEPTAKRVTARYSCVV